MSGFVAQRSGPSLQYRATRGNLTREPGTEIKVLDAHGKPANGLPEKGGYFEIRLPKALLENQPKCLELGWIDFYRR